MNQEKCKTLHLFFSLEKVKANNIQIETMIRKILPIVMVCAAFVDCQKRIWGLTDAFLWIQLVAERSLSFKRGLGVTQARARLKNDEGSAI